MNELTERDRGDIAKALRHLAGVTDRAPGSRGNVEAQRYRDLAEYVESRGQADDGESSVLDEPDRPDTPDVAPESSGSQDDE